MTTIKELNDYLENLYGCKFITVNEHEIVYDFSYQDIIEKKLIDIASKLSDDNIKKANDKLIALYGGPFLVIERINGKIECKVTENTENIEKALEISKRQIEDRLFSK